MNGQMSLFDFIQDPEQEKKDRAMEWSAGRQIAEGYRDGIKKKRCGEDNLPCAWKDGSHCDTCKRETLPHRMPCGRRCSVECFSKACFIRRGYIWAPEQDPRHNWLRDENGEIIIGPKQCDWEPVDKICRTCDHFARYTSGLGEIYHGYSCFGFGVSRSQDPKGNCRDWREAVDNEAWRTDDKALNAWLDYEEGDDENKNH